MLETSGQPRFKSWHVNGHPQIIEYEQRVLDRICSTVIEGYREFPHGGVEVGGVLFGEGDKHLVRILAYRPVACEHANGPSFLLSETDQEGLAELLEQYRDDPKLEGLAPVGLYLSHTRSEVNLRPKDQELHRHYFPEPWQIAIVFRPLDAGSLCAGIFVKDSSGTLPAEPTHFEGEIAVRVGVASPPVPQRREPEPAPVPDHRAMDAVSSPDADKDEEEPPLFSFVEETDGGGRSFTKWFAVAAGIIVLAAGLWAFNHWAGAPGSETAIEGYRQAAGRYWDSVIGYWRRGAAGTPEIPPSIALRTLASGPDLVIRWDPMAETLRGISGGRLLITDGGREIHRELDTAALFLGSLTYRRLTGDVRIRLTVMRGGAAPVVEVTRFLGADPTEGGSSNQSVDPALREELDRLRKQLQSRQTENAALDRRLTTLKRQATSRPPERQTPTAPKITLAQKPLALTPVPPGPAAKPVTLAQHGPQTAPATPPPGRSAIIQQPPAQPKPAQYSGPSSGRLIWTGRLSPGQSVLIKSGRPNQGSLYGKLPGVPVTISVYPAEFAGSGLVIYSGQPEHANGVAAEEPGPGNAFSRTTYQYDLERAKAVEVVLAPREANNWNTLSFRAAKGQLTVVVVDWRLQ